MLHEEEDRLWFAGYEAGYEDRRDDDASPAVLATAFLLGVFAVGGFVLGAWLL